MKQLKKWLVPLAMLSIVVASTWALFRAELFRVHDYTHAARVAEMARGIQDGQLPVRWSQNFGYGYGMPLYVFYAPLPYFIGALFYLAGVPMWIIFKLLILLPTAGLAAAMYYLARRWLPSSGALIATAAIVTAPYRAVNVFVRGAFSETWGMTFFVVTLLGLAMTYDKRKNGWLIFLSGIIGMMLSHNITVILSIVPLILFTALLIGEDRLKKPRKLAKWWHEVRSQIFSLIWAGLLALGLSAFYWLPAFTMKGDTQLDKYILGDYFNFRLHFLYIRQFFDDFWRFGGSSWGPQDDITFFLGWGQLLGIALSCFLGFWLLVFKRQRQWLTGFALALIGGICAFLSLQRALPIWEGVDILKYVQFPWRFLSVALPLLALFSAWWTTVKLPRGIYAGLAALVLSASLFNVRHFYPEFYISNTDPFYSSTPEYIQGPLAGILIDYVPTGFNVPESISDYPYDPPSTVRCVFKECKVETIFATSHEGLYRVTTTSEPESLLIARSYFPGWLAEVNGQSVAIQPGENDSMFVRIPAGESLVGIRFSRSQEMWLGDVLTILSGGIILYILFKQQGEHANV